MMNVLSNVAGSISVCRLVEGKNMWHAIWCISSCHFGVGTTECDMFSQLLVPLSVTIYKMLGDCL